MFNRRIRRAMLCGSAAAGALLALGSPTVAAAQAATYSFDIPAQDVSAALIVYGRTSRQQLVFDGAAVRNKTSSALVGEYAADDGLYRLLEGTGLRAEFAGDGAVRIVEAAQAPQPGSAAGGGAEVEALIVTAQKREEDIQDVPIAISAFTQEDLERSQVAGGPDLITQIPNFTFTKTNFTGYSIQIRGIGTQAISATTDPAVAVAFNNTPFVRNRFFEQEFYDLARVEVLRGPQGTLYGRNATAGVVNIISQKPRFNFEAKASADVSNYNSTRIEGMVNIPLAEDVAALRLAGAWTKRDGYSFNELTDQPIDGRDLWSTRVSLRVAPSDALDINLIWEHFEEDDDRLRSGKQLCHKDVVTQVGDIPIVGDPAFIGGGQGVDWNRVQGVLSQGCKRGSLYSPDAFQTPNGKMLPYYGPLNTLNSQAAFSDPYVSATQSRDLRVIESAVDPDYRARSDLAELQVSFDISDDLALSSETSYSTDELFSLQDLNRFNTIPKAWTILFAGQPSSLQQTGSIDENGVFCDPQIGCSDRLVLVDLSTAKSRQFSQELRLSSDFEGPLNFSVGVNFLRYDTEDKYYVFINSLTLYSWNFNSRVGGIFDPSEQFPQYLPNISDNRECLPNGLLHGNPNKPSSVIYCMYIDPNPIGSLNDQGHNYFLSRNPYKLISYAGFGEVYYEVADDLKIAAGLRWTVDKKEAPRIPTWLLVSNSFGYPVAEVIEQEWREPTGRLAIDWKPDLSFTDETLIYGSYARGYKAGGANPPDFVRAYYAAADLAAVLGQISAARPKTFEAEFVDAFEMGSKNTLFDGAVTLNLAAFYYDYKDYQISEIVERSAFNRNFDAEVWGFEIESDWRPLENLKLGFKGGYQKTRIADGEKAIDLMDRTAGNPDWILVRPFPTQASSCIVPTAIFTHRGTLSGVDLPDDLNPNGNLYQPGAQGGGNPGTCELAYLREYDPVTALPYTPNPTAVGPGGSLTGWGGAYPGWNPLDESQGHNGGEGLYKDLSGNELPNAPNWTATVTADYTAPLGGDWLATVHTDLHWQSESWWRIFNDHEFSRLDDYFTMNLAAILSSEETGWTIMAYVKNVTDETALTGAFLYSDDTALTTNVFLAEPRLYGLRVTKAWTGGPLLGSFGERRDGPYPFTIEIGGQIQRQDAPNEPLTPSFNPEFATGLDPLSDQDRKLDWGDGREIRLIYRPGDDWTASLAARFGRTNGSAPWSTRRKFADRFCLTGPLTPFSDCQNGIRDWLEFDNYTTSNLSEREEHTIIDFTVGRNVGFGGLEDSLVSGGLRYADLGSKTTAHIFGRTHMNIPYDEVNLFKYYPLPATFDRYEAKLSADREFRGGGPVVSWEASRPLFEAAEAGLWALDWSLTGGVLFGKQKTSVGAEEEVEHRSIGVGQLYSGISPRRQLPPGVPIAPASITTRSESITAPTFGASLGFSYAIGGFKAGAGYRWERYFDAIDGGYDRHEDVDRTIQGPYLKLSVGFGG